MGSKDTPLKASVEDGELVIRIGVDQLAHGTAAADAFHEYDDAKDKYLRSFAITDSTIFAKDIARALEAEKEDGSSPISDLLDSMAQAAIDDGTLSVELNQSIPYGQKSPLEKW